MTYNFSISLLHTRLPRRIISRSILHYTQYETRKKRNIKWNEDPNNLSWSKLLFERLEERSKEIEHDVSPIHVVQLVKKLNGRPWWEKQICEELSIGAKCFQPVFLKNIPGVNKMLFEVKHLLKIQPLRLPNGLPSHPSDFQYMTLKSNGELVFKKRLNSEDSSLSPNDENSLTKKYKYDNMTNRPLMYFQDMFNNVKEDSRFQKNRMSLETIKKVCDKQKSDFSVNSEFFDTKYEYKRNEDGNMYRYNFNKNIQKYEWH